MSLRITSFNYSGDEFFEGLRVFLNNSEIHHVYKNKKYQNFETETFNKAFGDLNFFYQLDFKYSPFADFIKFSEFVKSHPKINFILLSSLEFSEPELARLQSLNLSIWKLPLMLPRFRKQVLEKGFRIG